MAKMGISIYPHRESVQRWKEYLELASRYGFSRIFESLLNLERQTRNQIIQKYQPINAFSRKLGFEIIVDVAPSLFQSLQIRPDDLAFFKELDVDGFRMDESYSGMEESIMTCNPYGLKIEINASIYSHYADSIIDFQCVRSNLIACHNFYPQRNTGLSKAHFQKTNAKFKQLGLRLAAFVTSQQQNSFGPWPGREGLPTLECHRDLPIDCQVTHLLAMGDIDDILISNCFPSEDELKSMREVFGPVPILDVVLDEQISEIERKILFDELHISRGDVSGKIIRSTWPRVKYAGNQISLFNPKAVIQRGDVIVNSQDYGNYAGEMQVALSDFQNTGKSNIVGHIRHEHLMVIDEIKPWQKFRLRQSFVEAKK